MLLNLLTNAAQAMERFGRILLKSWADERQVFLSVQDNGKGMPAEVLGRIFDPFFTTKPVGQGTGSACRSATRSSSNMAGPSAWPPNRAAEPASSSACREQARELKRSA